MTAPLDLDAVRALAQTAYCREHGKECPAANVRGSQYEKDRALGLAIEAACAEVERLRLHLRALVDVVGVAVVPGAMCNIHERLAMLIRLADARDTALAALKETP